jgi:FkbM family methyltransferase
MLQNIEKTGFHPRTIIDIGAYVGQCSQNAASVFPKAKIAMIDGNPENKAMLERVQGVLGRIYCRYFIALLGREERTRVTFYLNRNGSTVLKELIFEDGPTVELQMVTLDGVLGDNDLEQPVLLKLDVQGYELEVLRGGKDTLGTAEVVIMETSLLPLNEGAPEFAEVVDFMKKAGFAVYDFCGQYRRDFDRALFQTDVVFVRESSALRSPNGFLCVKDGSQLRSKATV